MSLDSLRLQEGVFEGIDAVRESVGADMLVLYLGDDPDDGKCGLGSLMMKGRDGDFSGGRRADVASVVPAGCRTSSLAHEFGHNLGLAHDAREESKYGTFDWSRGHAVDDLFATTMAYRGGYGNIPGADIQYFSNPDIACPGGPCGVDR